MTVPHTPVCEPWSHSPRYLVTAESLQPDLRIRPGIRSNKQFNAIRRSAHRWDR